MKVVFIWFLVVVLWGALISEWVKRYRYSRLARKSESWPLTQATIHKSEAHFSGPRWGSAAKIPKSLFGYSYAVAEMRYIGFFAVVREINSLSDADLQQRLDGKSVRVRYDPQDPSISVVVDSQVEGKQIHQNPDWIPRSLLQEANEGKFSPRHAP